MVAEERRGKDDIKQNTLDLLVGGVKRPSIVRDATMHTVSVVYTNMCVRGSLHFTPESFMNSTEV